MPEDCKCPEKGFPLASFCVDDLFCPQCGEPVAWLTSANELPNPDRRNIRTADWIPDRVLWVYAREVGGKGTGFTLPLEYTSLNENHKEVNRPLILDPIRCEVTPHDSPYKFVPRIIARPEPHQVHIKLEPDPDSDLVRSFGETEWVKDLRVLPPRGIFCTLTLVGNCGKRTFGLLVCRSPRFEIEIQEGGQRISDNPFDDAEEPVDQAWALSRRGHHDLTMLIRCVEGFLHLSDMEVEDNPPISGPPEPRFAFRRTLPADRILGPGHDPCQIIASFDLPRDWKRGDLISLKVDFWFEVLGSEPVRIHLYLEPRGDVGFQPRGEMKVPLMYHGELKISQPEGTEGTSFPHVQISNIGERDLQIRRPEVERHSLPDVDWIRVDWLGGGNAAPQSTTLKAPDKKNQGDAGPSIDLTVTIDLTLVNSSNHKSGDPLIASILVQSMQDDRMPWKLPVIVPVEERGVLVSPLAIDFGNSNTYAVIMVGDQFLPLLGDGDHENFPTALFLADVPDPALSRIDIGRKAVVQGQTFPSSLVPRGLLKRALLADSRKWETVLTIRTPSGELLRFKAAELILLFLEKVILECETTLRTTVKSIGFSYPANFSPRARRRFDGILADLERRRIKAHPRIGVAVDVLRKAHKEAHPDEPEPGLWLIEPVSTFDSTPDEASAVAIELVHNERLFREKIEPDLGPEGTFLVASYDFGGGSIDCALLRFEFMGTPGFLRFKSEHLSFGGDESFGGDNVTLAVYQLALERFREVLATHGSGLEFPVAEPTEAPALGTDRWNNYQRLWDLSEELKHYLCNLNPADEDGTGRAATPATPAPTRRAEPGRDPKSPAGMSPALERFGSDVSDFLERIMVRDSASKQPTSLSDPRSLREPFRDALLKITLQDVYQRKIYLDRRQGLFYTVYARVEKSLKDLRKVVEEAWKDPGNKGPLFIVLAGSACRLPLVRQLIRTEFDEARVIGDPVTEPDSKPKSKVAYGLARYLESREYAGGAVEELSRAGRYTHGPIQWTGGGGNVKDWVPTCSHLADGKWHLLKDVPLKGCIRADHRINVYHKAFELEPIGYFDLSRPAREGDPKDKELPRHIDFKEHSEVLLKVDGSEDNLLLRVHYGREETGEWRRYGDWRLIPADGQ